MATIKACVQKARKDGFWPVYLRVTHHRKTAYIKTDLMVNDKGLSKDREVVDPWVQQQLAPKIVTYMERLNRVDIG